MVKITCKRCGTAVPKSSTRGSALWGGRICATCAKELGERIARAGMGYIPPKTVAPKLVEKKQGFFSRVAEKFLRRRGVR